MEDRLFAMLTQGTVVVDERVEEENQEEGLAERHGEPARGYNNTVVREQVDEAVEDSKELTSTRLWSCCS